MRTTTRFLLGYGLLLNGLFMLVALVLWLALGGRSTTNSSR